MRNLQIETPVTAVFWTHQKIFAIGTDDVIEFHDSNDYKEQINIGKIWQQCHEGDILCVSIRPLDAIVTACSHGDLIFWRYETGHPYMRFNLKNPSSRLQIVYKQQPTKSTTTMKSKKPRATVKNNKKSFDKSNDDNNNSENDVDDDDVRKIDDVYNHTRGGDENSDKR